MHPAGTHSGGWRLTREKRLDNPINGGLYVAEAGSGGDGPSFVSGSGETVFFGRSAGVSRALGGVQERLIGDLPSVAPAGGFGADGATEVAFDAAGTPYVTLGLGTDPAVRAGLPEGGELLGQIVKLDGGAVPFADIAANESANNPAGDEINSNPFGLAALPGGGFVVSDAGGNALLTVGEDGAISTAGILPALPNPAFPDLGGPVYQAVPTGLAVAPDGRTVVGQLTGFPFIPGAATIRELVSGSVLETIASGYTNLVDTAFGPDGALYVLEIDSDGLLGPGMTGALYEVAEDGTPRRLFGGLNRPTGLAVSQDGLFYVSNNGVSPTDGEVLVLSAEPPAAVPLPAGLPLLAGALGLLAAIRRRRSRAPTCEKAPRAGPSSDAGQAIRPRRGPWRCPS